MSIARTAVIVLLVVLLAVNTAAANAAIAADRTVLDADFVTTALEEEDAYADLEPVIVEQLPTEELEGSTAMPVDIETVVSTGIDAAYIQSQVEPNVERGYAYLHGETDELELVIDVSPAKSAIADAVETELADASPTELMETFETQQDGELTVESQGVTIDAVTVAEMAEDESVFRAEREALRETARERVVTNLVDQAFEEASNDELLALVIDDYDPNDYSEEEKAQLVQDREAEIRAAIQERIETERGDEIDTAVEEELSSNREQARADVSAEIDSTTSDLDPALAEPIESLLLLAVDGYLADITYEEYRAEFQSVSDELAAGIATVVEDELAAEAPDEIDLASDLDPESDESLQTARDAVGLIGLLALGLPVVGLGLIGAIYLVSRRIDTTAIAAGVGLVVGGLPALAGARLLPGMLESTLAGNGAPALVTELVPALAGQVADAVLLQSGVVVGLGVVVLGAGLALYFELVEWPESA